MDQEANRIRSSYPQCSLKPNISKLLSNHERGFLKKSLFKSQVTKIKVRQFKRSAVEYEIDPDISYCKFIRTNSDTDCLIGVWQKNMDPASKHSSVYHLKFEYNQQHNNTDKYEACPIISDLSCSGPFFKRMDVTDSCERNIKDKSCLLYVGNTAVSGGRVVLNITDLNPENSEGGLSEIVWRSPKCIWSCASNAHSERFAAGTESGCSVFDVLNFMEVENLQANILAVEFNKLGNLLYCGREKGELTLYDLRQDACDNINWFFNRTGFTGIKEMKLLSDEISMILCGTDGALWRMDLRMKRPLFQYPGYSNKQERRTLSVDEDLDLLCATADDNISRIWSLKSGDLLKTIYPFDDKTRTNSHACLVASQRRFFVAVVQANVLTPVLHY